MSKKKTVDYYIGPNELKDENGRVGLLANEVDPDTFLSTESIQYSQSTDDLVSYTKYSE